MVEKLKTFSKKLTKADQLINLIDYKDILEYTYLSFNE